MLSSPHPQELYPQADSSLAIAVQGISLCDNVLGRHKDISVSYSSARKTSSKSLSRGHGPMGGCRVLHSSLNQLPTKDDVIKLA